MRSEKITLGDAKPGTKMADVLHLVHPKVATDEEIAWSFPHDTDNNGDNNVVGQRFRSPVGKKVNNFVGC